MKKGRTSFCVESFVNEVRLCRIFCKVFVNNKILKMKLGCANEIRLDCQKRIIVREKGLLMLDTGSSYFLWMVTIG